MREFLAARVPVDNAIIAAAAKTGDLYLVNMLLAEMGEKKARQKPEKPMLSVLGTSHFEMVKALTELFNFNPLWRARNGKSWPELAEERNGPMWRQEKELLQRLYDMAYTGSGKDRRSSSPVTKRDGAKRKFLTTKEEDESDAEDETSTRMAKRKNGRRLMSRKDMRKSGALDSDSDDEEMEDESTPEIAPANDDVHIGEQAAPEMKPPETPSIKRKLRSKSISSQPSDMSPKSLRKRSNSLRRASGDKAAVLPTLEEKVEENNSGSDGIVVAESERLRRDRAEDARFAIEQAKRFEEKRREEAAAEAEAKRIEEEVARKAEAERKAEEEKKAEEERKVEEARRKEEEMRMREQERIAEEERAQREREME